MCTPKISAPSAPVKDFFDDARQTRNSEAQRHNAGQRHAE